jgi:hypothetical protein
MAVNKKSLENLIDINEQGMSKEQLSENGRKGGIASGKARREKKEMKDAILSLFELGLTKGKTQDFKSFQDANGKNVTVLQGIILAQTKKALKGDTRAAEFLRDTAGMKPVDKQEIQADFSGTGKLDEILKALSTNDED